MSGVNAKRIVVKVGTSVLTDAGSSAVERRRVEEVASGIAALWRQRKEVVLVTSGAIGVGMGILGLKRRPAERAWLQAAAAAGQGRLMHWYSAHFEREGLHAAQILLTRDDLEERVRYFNARATLLTLLKAGAVPVINENDSVSVEELRYGDNDVLSAHVASLVDAGLLVLLSDVDRFRGPAGLPAVITEITPEMERAAKGTTKAVSTGGMRTKLEAARIAMASGIPMVLADGRQTEGWVKLLASGEGSAGTWFLHKGETAFTGRKRWAALTGKPKGTVLVDGGAREALVQKGKSLLASGVRGVEGHFRKGDLVSVVETNGKEEFARGIARYPAVELEKIKGLKSTQVAETLGRKAEEVIHRDSLVVLRA